MDRLAVELLERIFILACTDGGYTGASLSRVSKHIRAVSRGARFYTVALLSQTPAQVATFFACYARERALPRAIAVGPTPKVRHLIISSSVRHEPAPIEIAPPRAAPDAKRSEQLRAIAEKTKAQVRKAVQEEQQRYSEDVAALLRIVAPDVQTLTLIHCHRYGKQELLMPDTIDCPGGFPVLRELTIVGNEPQFSAPGCDAAFEPMFPRLDRLHLSLAALAASPRLDFTAWADRAPGLTHLRVTGADFWPRSILEAVRKLFESEYMMSSLKRIIVQPHSPPPMGGPCGTPHWVFASFLKNLDDICKASRVPTALLPPMKLMREMDWEVAAVRQWADRIHDGPGCWSVGALRERRKQPPPVEA